MIKNKGIGTGVVVLLGLGIWLWTRRKAPIVTAEVQETQSAEALYQTLSQETGISVERIKEIAAGAKPQTFAEFNLQTYLGLRPIRVVPVHEPPAPVALIPISAELAAQKLASYQVQLAEAIEEGGDPRQVVAVEMAIAAAKQGLLYESDGIVGIAAAREAATYARTAEIHEVTKAALIRIYGSEAAIPEYRRIEYSLAPSNLIAVTTPSPTAMPTAITPSLTAMTPAAALVLAQTAQPPEVQVAIFQALGVPTAPCIWGRAGK